MTDNVDLTFLAAQVQKSIDEMRHVRKEVGDMRKIVLALVDQSQRVERRFNGLEARISEFGHRLDDLRADLELTIKIELGGAMTHLETTFENSLAKTDAAVADLAMRVDALERRFGPPS